MHAAKHRVEEEEEEKEGGVKETNNYTASCFNCKNHTLAFLGAKCTFTWQ